MTFAAALVVLFAAVAGLVAHRYFRVLLIIGLAAVFIGGLALALPVLLPKDFFVRYPQFENTPINPYLSVLYGGVALVFGGGVSLGLLCRFLLLRLSRHKPKANVA